MKDLSGLNGKHATECLGFEYASTVVGRSKLIHADCFEWFSRLPENSLHAIVTDPPYGVKEYDFDQLEKRAKGNGGWPAVKAQERLERGLPRVNA
jgi:site-specific DNA-methyltransferase (adenine-specific)